MMIDGEKVVLASETKIAVPLFQDKPPGISPYMILAGCSQTMHESNSFAPDIMSVSAETCKLAGNEVLTGDLTDGVSCETQSNVEQEKKILRGESNQLSFIDPNHNNKNCRYQLQGSSGAVPALIGNHVFDPMMLKLVGIPKELIQVEHYASDALDLKSACAKVTELY